MSDERLRELERAWRETGSAQAETSLLRERLRSGVITMERIELAAYCAAPAAEATLRDLDGACPKRPAGLSSWIRGLEPYGQEAAVRAAMAAAHEVLSEREDPALRSAIETAAQAWFTNSSPPRAERTGRATIEDHLLDVVRVRGAFSAALQAVHVAERSFEALTFCDGSTVRRAKDLIPRLQAELIPWALGHEDPLRQRWASS